MVNNESFKMSDKFVADPNHAAPPKSNFIQVVLFLCAKNNHSIKLQKL